MKLETVLALRPSEGADSAAISAAIHKAQASRRDLAVKVLAADAFRANELLTAGEKALAAAERDAADARLAIERIDALLPLLRADFAGASGRETLDALRAEHVEVAYHAGALDTWERDVLPQIRTAIATGFSLQDAAVAARTNFVARVESEYRRPEVRDAGPLGVTLPRMGGLMPRSLFPNWSETNG